MTGQPITVGSTVKRRGPFDKTGTVKAIKVVHGNRWVIIDAESHSRALPRICHFNELEAVA